ncbi:MAG: homoserine kinase [Gammaproteobacteria bacterium]|uniref:Homoserine kinase n=1 Tax=Candidatus Thiopontia autotrophica TaxID=2841688 RepID=A0A8J6P9C2_9GAMM|nr:homoserine kinase [Candidatus Thiopontia autotrophica]MBL6969604.1 homoserine kinase [Gammaproteobacteria bacterium]
MSVYTTVSQDELVELMGQYSVGELISYEGIQAGIENTNYFVSTTDGEFVLTIFEQLEWEELPYFLDIMAFLAEHKVPSAHPIADKSGEYLRKFLGKPAALVQRLNGRSVDYPNQEQCAALGKALGRMHSMAHNFSGHRENPRGIRWCRETIQIIAEKMGSDDKQLLEEELQFQSVSKRGELPQGIIHADLFRDNALFVGEQLTGIIDFYYACNDALLYDVAITVNDWCTGHDGSINSARYSSFLTHYREQRPVTEEEYQLWPTMLRAAALRFWLSRLQDLHFPRPGEMTHTKDPDAFRQIMVWHRDNPLSL